MSFAPDNDDRGPSPDELIWYRGKLVESDYPDMLEERRARSARRCMVDWPEEEEYERG